jgi:hypothetical protein
MKKILLFIFALNQIIIAYSQPDTIRYIFIGHCYQEKTDGSKVDYRLEKMDFSPYAGIWLGGDVCSEASLKYSTLQYIDRLFDLSNPLTFWALGNHDTRNGNLDWIQQFTRRPSFFANYYKGITEIVLNTNILPNNCFLLDKQFEMIKNVCDTIQKSSHLILLMHHGIWNNVPGIPPNPANYAHSSLLYWNANCYDVNSNFVNAVYPLLVKVQKRGIQVICVMGDVGATAKKFDYLSDDGIHFLGCGLYHNSPDDYVLIFSHIPSQRKLIWKFVLLNSLL